MLTLRRAVDQINATLPADEQWSAESFGRIVSGIDENNRHLWLPDDPKVVERTEPLADDTEVFGAHLVAFWWAHWPLFRIESYEDAHKLAERAETCSRTFDGTWVFINGTLRDCRFVDSVDVPGYRVHSTVCGCLFAIEDGG
jgi:hypothetical protein